MFRLKNPLMLSRPSDIFVLYQLLRNDPVAFTRLTVQETVIESGSAGRPSLVGQRSRDIFSQRRLMENDRQVGLQFWVKPPADSILPASWLTIRLDENPFGGVTASVRISDTATTLSNDLFSFHLQQ